MNWLQIDDGSYTISDDMWIRAKWALTRKYGDSANFDITANVVKDFEYTAKGVPVLMVSKQAAS